MGYLPIKPCPKCKSRQRGMWIGGGEDAWKIVCQDCGLEQWFESSERAVCEYVEHDEHGMVHFDGDGLDIAFELHEVKEG